MNEKWLSSSVYFFKVWESEADVVSLNMLLNWTYILSCLVKIVVLRLYWCVYSNTNIWEIWNASENAEEMKVWYEV
jgi:hypothetical protein